MLLDQFNFIIMKFSGCIEFFSSLRSKKYERSIRKLRKFMYNETKGDVEHSNLIDAIQKVRHGNLNNSIAGGRSGDGGARKYETALSRIEKVGSFTTNYEHVMHVKSPIDKPKNAVCEIMPGFLKDNNLRIVYEALKVSSHTTKYACITKKNSVIMKFKLFSPTPTTSICRLIVYNKQFMMQFRIS